MNKIDLKIIPSVDTSDIIHFIETNSNNSWNESCTILTDELQDIQNNFPGQVGMIDSSERICKVVVSELTYDGWIKKFTETQELKEDYYILFTD